MTASNPQPPLPPSHPALAALPTPALLLDAPRMAANIARMATQVARLGVAFRPHVKTAKSVDVLRAMQPDGPGPITASTLHEAQVFADAGWRDITYAVGLAPNKLPQVAALLARGVALRVIVDTVDAAQALAAAAPGLPAPLGVLIEIDGDGHRAGIEPQDPALLAVAAVLAAAGPGLRLDGVLTHLGGSYDRAGAEAMTQAAERERAAAVQAAERLRAAGHAAPVVSVGSTPTGLFAQHLQGVTELRCGVYVFMDLVMAGLGVCGTQDIAASVLTSVIGRRADKGWTLVDAGWMALSRDRGTAGQAQDQGYGLVCDVAGRVLTDYTVVATNQEHGIIAHRSGEPARGLDLAVGTLLRILPNHACATCAPFDAYQVIGADGAPQARWPRFNGW